MPADLSRFDPTEIQKPGARIRCVVEERRAHIWQFEALAQGRLRRILKAR